EFDASRARHGFPALYGPRAILGRASRWPLRRHLWTRGDSVLCGDPPPAIRCPRRAVHSRKEGEKRIGRAPNTQSEPERQIFEGVVPCPARRPGRPSAVVPRFRQPTFRTAAGGAAPPL